MSTSMPITREDLTIIKDIFNIDEHVYIGQIEIARILEDKITEGLYYLQSKPIKNNIYDSREAAIEALIVLLNKKKWM